MKTSEVEEAEDLLQRIGAPARIATRAGVPNEVFRFNLSGRGDQDVTFASFGVDGRWSVETDLDIYVLAASLDGAVSWCSSGQEGVIAEEPILVPAGGSVLEVNGLTRLFEVQFTSASLLRFARDFHDVDYADLRIEPGAARSPKHRAMLGAALRYSRALVSSGAVGEPQLLASLKANLAVALLSSFDIAGPRREWRLSRPAERKAYQRAVGFTETRAGDAITVLDVARYVEMPLELLDAAFRGQTGDSVAAYLKMARTVGAHAELVRSRGDVADIAAIARRWGFTSRGHLLHEHSKLYPPSELRTQVESPTI